jgi:CRP-like cAMP-binding protein
MVERPRHTRQRSSPELLLDRLSGHGKIPPTDANAIRKLRVHVKTLSPKEDVVHQGERPDVAVFVICGMLGRYHMLPNGDRQYLSFHIGGDMPDVQSLYLTVMDHSVCAMGRAEVALFPHDQLRDLLLRRPSVGIALWRLTLVDAAIFRQAITNNSARDHIARLSHFLCEYYFRSRAAQLVEDDTCNLPLSQTEIGQALGMSLVSVNRALQELRKDKMVELRRGRLTMLNWSALARTAGFDATYLYVA